MRFSFNTPLTTSLLHYSYLTFFSFPPIPASTPIPQYTNDEEEGEGGGRGKGKGQGLGAHIRPGESDVGQWVVFLLPFDLRRSFLGAFLGTSWQQRRLSTAIAS